ncbi:hypothetical protein [Paraburkholderia sp. BCC1885]|uniref:hypothetical protein n=1 Tax=Paraburkholderia sp. BCC1885 TaxID=2562669 RepID=UPI001183D7C1|nr:hypothetical protein [Paraburkholderia sp. BCC1885]
MEDVNNQNESWAILSVSSEPTSDSGSQLRARQAESEVRRLSERLKVREQQIAHLRNTLIDTASLYQAVKEKLELELESRNANQDAMTSHVGVVTASSSSPNAVVITLPYLTRELRVLIEAMNTYYADFDERHPPKSTEVARAIDRRLNYREQPGHEPSRTGQTYAAAIRPEKLRDADRRHHHDRNPDDTA